MRKGTEKYRVFVKDHAVNVYNTLTDVYALDTEDALRLGDKVCSMRRKLLALPHTLKHLWPDAVTGKPKRGTTRLARMPKRVPR